MSTVDPAKPHSEVAAPAPVVSLSAAVGIVVGVVLIAAGAAFQVRALFSVAELDTAHDLSELSLPVFGLVIGVPMLLAGLFLHIGAGLRCPGTLLRAPGIGRIAAVVIGISIGAWWGLATVPSSRELWFIPVAATVLGVLLLVRDADAALRSRETAPGLLPGDDRRARRRSRA